MNACNPSWASSIQAKPEEPVLPTHQVPAPSWPEPPKAPAGAPNVVLILIDDVGFGTTSTFGGPIHTPNFDRLAQGGLRYNSFHVNSLCSPSRASLLTGRNNHQVGFGSVAEWSAPYPGYNTQIPKSTATVAEVLKENGYSTAAFGKWHNTPTWQVSPAGPFDRWPTGLGFEYFYGFNQGFDSQYYPRLFRNTSPVEPDRTPAQGYHLTTDITNDAIRWLHEHDAVAHEKPFFLYFAPGATHSPHQIGKQWTDRYKGQFDAGWDAIRRQSFERQKKLGVIPANAELTPRPASLPAWDSLTPAQQKLLAHQAEVYAGFTEQTDEEVGRLLDAIHDEGLSDNTVVLWIFGDNGASAEGGLEGSDLYQVNGKAAPIAAREEIADQLGSEIYMNHFAAAWAWSLSSPFQGTKQDASHLGGTTDPLLISWPGHLQDTEKLRSQFAHVNDIAPTLYELAGITPPSSVNGVEQLPLEGTSLVYTFSNAQAPTRHRLQYFATSGNRGIYKDGWWAGSLDHFTWENGGMPTGTDQNLASHSWELYHLDEDYSQAHDLAARNPAKLKELIASFDQEAERNHAYPLLPRRAAYPAGQAGGQTRFVYRAGVERLSNYIAPNLSDRAYTLSADVEVPATGKAEGVIFAEGGVLGGLSLFVQQGRVVYEINANGQRSGQIVSSEPLPTGHAQIELTLTPVAHEQQANQPFQPGAAIAADAVLKINGRSVGQGHFANVNVRPFETLDIGSDLGSAVSHDYTAPNRFTGVIDQVTLELR